MYVAYIHRYVNVCVSVCCGGMVCVHEFVCVYVVTSPG